ncbi:hypothetical protein [Candidatus Carsonella ruddii]|uniref:N-(5'-phosphoribosyl)anthranilate isomerase n=1 Tax=Candidatus Carsonella ruddii (Diaphorina cf. continua) TaxID=2661587 RepID=A0A7R6W036_CARRU|nr:hypothetical protein [Candidatus Carsonella ruddii (Diaphorina cf. continua)]BCG49317.1 phosphoribosylanthranilate isomerase [Candidatus Carsonella ruddii (Diaphorina cf. continua)]
MKIKFCGIKSKVDLKKSILSNCNFIGLNFYKKSKRYISTMHSDIIKMLPPYLKSISLFVNNSFFYILKKKNKFKFLQFHGNENFLFCELFKKKYLKTLKILKKNIIYYYSDFFLYFLIDKKNLNFGGCGIPFLHFKINLIFCFIISGGINNFNLIKIKKNTSCDFYDICSGVEYLFKKNLIKMILY